MRWIRTRLSVRLTLTMLFVSLGPLSAAGFVVLRLTEESLRRQVESQQTQLAAVSARYVRDYIRHAQDKLRSISALLAAEPSRAQTDSGGKLDRRSNLRALDNADLVTRLNRFIEPSDLFVDLSFKSNDDVQQEAYVAQSRLDVRQTQGLLEWQQQFRGQAPAGQSAGAPAPSVQVLQGIDYISPTLNSTSDLPFLPMALPLQDGKQVYAFVTGSLDFRPVMATLKEFARPTDRSRGYVIQLLDDRGRALLSTGPPPEDAIATALEVGHQGWRVVVAEPRTEAFAPLAQARMQALAMMGGAGVLAFALSLVLASWILRPVRGLTAAADAMRGGALGTRSGVDREDEIGRLAKSFDQMAAALQELDRMKSDFVAHVSHELRTPLTAMRLAVANLQDGIAGPLDAKPLEILGRLRADIERLIRMVNEVLDVARIEAGKLELSKGPVDLADVARAVAANMEPLAAAKRLTLEVAVGGGRVSGDREKLYQVVANLVDNAIKFTPAGGSVRVDGAAGVLRVSDTGPGIAPELLPRIFDRFARAGAVNAGAGLGLSISKKIVELHGGALSVESGVGKGSIFTVRLPCPASSS